MADYDPKKEKIFKKEEIVLSTGTKALIKYYSYDGGEKRTKMNFVSERRNGGEFVTNKFPGLASKKDVRAIAKGLAEVAKEMK